MLCASAEECRSMARAILCRRAEFIRAIRWNRDDRVVGLGDRDEQAWRTERFNRHAIGSHKLELLLCELHEEIR